MNALSNNKLDSLLLKHSFADTVKCFLLSFIPLCFLILSVFLYVEYLEFDEQREISLVTEKERVDSARAFLIKDISILAADLRILSEDPDFNRLLNSGGDQAVLLGKVEHHFKSFMRIRGLYDQIRYINAEGLEVIRINYNSGMPSVVVKNDLQNKSDRYYFRDSIIYEKDRMYLSPLDLNVEGGEVEEPKKPVIRAAMTVFDEGNNLKGIVIVNYLARGMLDSFKSWMHPGEYVDTHLVNGNGYWLSHTDSSNEWGFMLEGDKSFRAEFPEAWDQISGRADGTFVDKESGFVYRTVKPSLGFLEKEEVFLSDHSSTEGWYVISQINFPTFYDYIVSRKPLKLSVLIFLLLIAGVAAREHAKWRIKRGQRESLTNLLFHGIEKSPAAIFITSVDGRIEYVNEAFELLTGYDIQEVLGCNPRIIKSGFHKEKDYSDLWKVIKSGEVWEGRLKNRRKDGSYYWVDGKIAPLFDEAGRISHFFCIQGDVSELLAQRDELENRTEQLSFERSKANAANKAKSEFLANMSHEIRTPMNAIVGLTHLLKNSDVTKPQRTRLDKIDNAAEYLLTIINDILDLSKIEAGKLTLEKTSFNIDELLEQIESLLKVQVVGKDIALIVENHNCPAWVMGDAVRLRQAILNYAVNAIKFTEQGRVTLRVCLMEQTEHEYLLRFEVEDTGIGIREDKLEELFEAFKQADASTTRKFGGTGLGLAINQNLARLMGGTVGATSVEGTGSTFWFTARFGIGSEPDQSVLDDSNFTHDHLAKACKGMRVLLVDDNEINLEVGAELLEVIGCHVDQAHNGRVAVEKAKETHYALILMDLQMPEMDGVEATTIIRSLPGYSTIPILAMTANVYKQEQEPCLKAGMNDFIPKPVNPTKLYNIIGKWLGLQQEVFADNSTDIVQEENKQCSLVLDLDSLAAVFGSKVERQHQILRKFLPQLHEIRESIQASVSSEDCAQVAFYAHKLKSSSRMVGAIALSDACLLLEQTGKASDTEELEASERTFLIAADHAEREIQNFLD